ncbi:MAG: PRC-barrel domain-containing protein, partial [Gemmatimonadetes bacterium]|nr:PRC-barrel domain-containing protein [Gemmatimonadota bacterium]
VFDLVGCRVEDEDGSELGKVADVQEMPSADLLVIRNGQKEVLIPLVGDFVTEVLVSERRVVVAGVEDLVRTGRNRK